MRHSAYLFNREARRIRCYLPRVQISWGMGDAMRITGPGLIEFDFALMKNNSIKRISENFNVQFRVETFNLFNHANFNSPIDNASLFDQTGAPIAGAGMIDSTSTSAREIQFGIKLIW